MVRCSGFLACALSIAATVVWLLLGLGWFVIRPATRTIRRQVDELETRVALRTRELSAALEALRTKRANGNKLSSRCNGSPPS